MANQVHVGMGYDVTLTFTKDNGQPGDIQDGKLNLELTNPAMGAIKEKTPFNAATGVAVVSIDHNGSVGLAQKFTVWADGDLGLGEKRVLWSDDFDFLAADGASGVSAVVGTERASPGAGPTPVPPVTP